MGWKGTVSWRTRSHNCGGERAKGEQKEERGLSNAMPPTTAPVWQQKVVRLSPRRRGCHLVTRDVADEIRPLLKNKCRHAQPLRATHVVQPHHQRELRSERSARHGNLSLRRCPRRERIAVDAHGGGR